MGTTSGHALAAALREAQTDTIARLRKGWSSWRLRPGWRLEHSAHPNVYIEVTLDNSPLFRPGVLDALRLSAEDIDTLTDACIDVVYARILGITESELEFE